MDLFVRRSGSQLWSASWVLCFFEIRITRDQPDSQSSSSFLGVDVWVAKLAKTISKIAVQILLALKFPFSIQSCPVVFSPDRSTNRLFKTPHSCKDWFWSYLAYSPRRFHLQFSFDDESQVKSICRNFYRNCRLNSCDTLIEYVLGEWNFPDESQLHSFNPDNINGNVYFFQLPFWKFGLKSITILFHFPQGPHASSHPNFCLCQRLSLMMSDWGYLR